MRSENFICGEEFSFRPYRLLRGIIKYKFLSQRMSSLQFNTIKVLQIQMCIITMAVKSDTICCFVEWIESSQIVSNWYNNVQKLNHYSSK